MRVYGCTTCESIWIERPPRMLEPGVHLATDERELRCDGAVETLAPMSLMSADAAAVHRAEALRDAAIARAEALADEAQKAIAELYFDRKATMRISMRGFAAMRRAETAEAALKNSKEAPARVMLALLACRGLLVDLSAKRPCPSCRSKLEHRPHCRLKTIADRLTLLCSDRLPPHKFARSRARRSIRRGA